MCRSTSSIAALTFAVVNVPQAMGHALLATVNPVLGIYTLMVAVPIGANKALALDWIKLYTSTPTMTALRGIGNIPQPDGADLSWLTPAELAASQRTVASYRMDYHPGDHPALPQPEGDEGSRVAVSPVDDAVVAGRPDVPGVLHP